jgi:hypothetical protein
VLLLIVHITVKTSTENAKEDSNKERQKLKGTTPSKEPERVREAAVTAAERAVYGN